MSKTLELAEIKEEIKDGITYLHFIVEGTIKKGMYYFKDGKSVLYNPLVKFATARNIDSYILASTDSSISISTSRIPDHIEKSYFSSTTRPLTVLVYIDSETKEFLGVPPSPEGGILNTEIKLEPTNYEVLIYKGNFVNSNSLSKGIYSTSMACLYEEGTTIDELVKRAESLRGMLSDMDMDLYISNLKKCELKTYKLSPKED